MLVGQLICYLSLMIIESEYLISLALNTHPSTGHPFCDTILAMSTACDQVGEILLAHGCSIRHDNCPTCHDNNVNLLCMFCSLTVLGMVILRMCTSVMWRRTKISLWRNGPLPCAIRFGGDSPCWLCFAHIRKVHCCSESWWTYVVFVSTLHASYFTVTSGLQNVPFSCK